MHGINRDPGVLAMFATEDTGLGQDDFLMTTEMVVSNAVIAAMGSSRTKVFSNLCNEGQLKEWNKMQADKTVVIGERKNLSVPANSPDVVDPIRVTYRELDKEMFDLAIILNSLSAGYDVTDFAAVLLTDNMVRNIMNVLDGDDKLVGKLKSGLTIIFKKYPVALILKQKDMFMEKINDLFLELEKENATAKPDKKNIRKPAKAVKKALGKQRSKKNV